MLRELTKLRGDSPRPLSDQSSKNRVNVVAPRLHWLNKKSLSFINVRPILPARSQQSYSKWLNDFRDRISNQFSGAWLSSFYQKYKEFHFLQLHNTISLLLLRDKLLYRVSLTTTTFSCLFLQIKLTTWRSITKTCHCEEELSMNSLVRL